METPTEFDTGDIVFHRPTRERWVVACVHEGRLRWMGWPDGEAAVADCELREKADSETRARILRVLSSAEGHRGECARQRLTAEVAHG